MKQVRETNAGSSISAWVVLDKKGNHVATVQAHYAGTVSVDVWNHGDKVTRACLATALKTGKLSEKALANKMIEAPDYYEGLDDRTSWAAYELFGLQQRKAGGYGYDKFAAALAGMIIDGHTMANHCGSVPEDEKKRTALMKAYKKAAAAGDTRELLNEYRQKAEKIGCHWANWQEIDGKGQWASLYFADGLSRLGMLGYKVVQAI